MKKPRRKRRSYRRVLTAAAVVVAVLVGVNLALSFSDRLSGVNWLTLKRQ